MLDTYLYTHTQRRRRGGANLAALRTPVRYHWFFNGPCTRTHTSHDQFFARARKLRETGADDLPVQTTHTRIHTRIVYASAHTRVFIRIIDWQSPMLLLLLLCTTVCNGGSELRDGNRDRQTDKHTNFLARRYVTRGAANHRLWLSLSSFLPRVPLLPLRPISLSHAPPKYI